MPYDYRPVRTAVANQTLDITITDSAQANLAALVAAHSLVAGGFFTVTGTGDTTDNALQAVKGSVPAAGDRFWLSGDSGRVSYRPYQ